MNIVKSFGMRLWDFIYTTFLFPVFLITNNNDTEKLITPSIVDYINEYINEINSKYGKVDSVFEMMYENGITSYTLLIEPYDNINEKELVNRTKSFNKGFVNINNIILNFSDLYFLSFCLVNKNSRDGVINDIMEFNADVTNRFSI